MAAYHFVSVFFLLALSACGSSPNANTNAGGGVPALANADESASSLETGETVASADPNGAFKGALGVVGTRKLYIEDMDTLMLFADERLEAQTIIAKWATAVGFEVIDPQTVARTLQQAAAGKNPTTGARCGPPLDRRWATNRWMGQLGSAGHLKAAIYCQPDCTMQLSLRLDTQGTEFFAAGFDSSAPWREELHRSLRLLKDNGGHGRHGHLNNPVAVSGSKRSSELGDLVLDEVDVSPAPKALLDKVADCGAGGRTSRLLVERTADGKTRCEGVDSLKYTTSTGTPVAACFCKTLDLKEQTARSVLTIEDSKWIEAVDKTKTGLELSASILVSGIYSEDEWTEQSFFADCVHNNCGDVGACFLDRSVPLESTRLGTTITFDKEGVATRAAIADFEQLLQPDEHACVVKRLMSLRIPCPDAASSSRKAKLDIKVSEAPAN